MAHERAKKRDLAVETIISEDLGMVDVDERRIKQVAFNLFSNAIKFTPKNGEIKLIAEKTDKEFVLTVSDTGKGISKEWQGQISGRVSKGDITRQNADAGLGLALVKSFVELHGSHVELKSEVNVGTSVSCYLPVSVAAASQHKQVS